MSVCVSSSLSSGMSHVSHLHLTSTLSMMQSFQNHHSMAPSSTVLANSLDLSHAQPSGHQMQNSSSSSSSDMNEPNSEMLLALIARNKTLEGECNGFLSSRSKQICRRENDAQRKKAFAVVLKMLSVRKSNTTRFRSTVESEFSRKTLSGMFTSFESCP